MGNNKLPALTTANSIQLSSSITLILLRVQAGSFVTVMRRCNVTSPESPLLPHSTAVPHHYKSITSPAASGSCVDAPELQTIREPLVPVGISSCPYTALGTPSAYCLDTCSFAPARVTTRVPLPCRTIGHRVVLVVTLNISPNQSGRRVPEVIQYSFPCGTEGTPVILRGPDVSATQRY
ncbi:hypothetical protein E2C01_048483 [Portunus trituberculatus]|uniref:Uncharacterized protein n=1 Tax=Portunus trituberculatus TaxID=210409 RepID=A0A5B7G6J2_PORTR|nr:hypothetical protein [Portunus trituberculatus]